MGESPPHSDCPPPQRPLLFAAALGWLHCAGAATAALSPLADAGDSSSAPQQHNAGPRRSLLSTYSTSVSYYVVNQWNGACLDAPSVWQAQANACSSGTATQQWALVASSYSGYYQLQNVGLGGSGTSAYCLDLSYGTLVSGQAVDVYNCAAVSSGSGQARQLFMLPPVGAWGSLTISASGTDVGTPSGFCVDNGAHAGALAASKQCGPELRSPARHFVPACRNPPAAHIAPTARTVPGLRRAE